MKDMDNINQSHPSLLGSYLENYRRLDYLSDEVQMAVIKARRNYEPLDRKVASEFLQGLLEAAADWNSEIDEIRLDPNIDHPLKFKELQKLPLAMEDSDSINSAATGIVIDIDDDSIINSDDGAVSGNSAAAAASAIPGPAPSADAGGTSPVSVLTQTDAIEENPVNANHNPEAFNCESKIASGVALVAFFVFTGFMLYFLEYIF